MKKIIQILTIVICVNHYLLSQNINQVILKNDFLLNDDDTGRRGGHNRASVAISNIGRIAVAWMDDRRGTYDIYFQMYSKSGTPYGKNIKINDDKNIATHSMPTIAVDTRGFWGVTWSDDRNGKKEIFFQLIDSNGVCIGSNIQVSKSTNGSGYFHSLTSDLTNQFVIAWIDNSPSNSLYSQRIDSMGNLFGDRIMIQTNVQAIDLPSISCAPDGGFAVAWHAQGANDYDVFLRRYNKQDTPIGSTIVLNDSTRSNQQYPRIAYSKNGSLMTVWEDGRTDSLYHDDILCQLFDSVGNRIGKNKKINDDSTSSQQSTPRVSSGISETWNFCWTDYRSGRNIYFQHVNNSGATTTKNMKINPDSIVNAEFSNIATNDNGIIALVWEGGQPGIPYASDIFLQIMKSDEYKINKTIQVNDDVGAVDQVNISLSLNHTGQAVASWQDTRDGISRIYYQRFTVDSGKISKNIALYDTLAGANASAIAISDGQNVSVVWEGYYNLHSDIYFQRFDQWNNKQGTVNIVNKGIFREQYEPSVANDNEGNTYVVWQNDRTGNVNIYLQKYDPAGQKIGDAHVVNDSVYAFRYHPVIAVGQSGTLVVVWGDDRTWYSDVYAQWFTLNGTKIGNALKINDGPTTINYSYPTVAIDSSGRTLFAWKDYRNNSTSTDVYIQRFSFEGNRIGKNTKINEESIPIEEIGPSLAMSPEGNIIVVWHQYSIGKLGNGIIAQKIHSDGTLWGKNFHILDDEYRRGGFDPVVSANSTAIVFAWRDNRRFKGWDAYTKISSWDWDGITSVPDKSVSPISSYVLKQNYPNPFNPSTIISYQIPRIGIVRIKVFDVLGKQIETLVNEIKNPGEYQITWNANKDSGGVYLVTMESDLFRTAKKILYIK